MKALSVQQPWAALLLTGQKTIEVRSWKTPHRGLLLICASAVPKEVFFKLKNEPAELLPAGGIMGIVELIDCRPMTKNDDGASFGCYSPGAFAWVIKHVALCRPDKLKGALGLFNVPDEKITRLGDDDNFWEYPRPQGEVKFDAKKHHHIQFD